MKKTVSLVLALILIIGLAASCSKKAVYRTDVSVSDLSTAVEHSLDPKSLKAMDESYLKGAMKLDPTLFADYVVKMNAQGVNIDEYGIFQAKNNDSVASVEKAVKDYIQLRKDTWMDEYMPAEKPKLEDAEVRTCGLYVMYAILPDNQKEKALTDFEKTLKS